MGDSIIKQTEMKKIKWGSLEKDYYKFLLDNFSLEKKVMSDYPYNLTAIATHLRELAQSIAKKLDISEQDAWDLCIEKLEYKYSYMTREEDQ